MTEIRNTTAAIQQDMSEGLLFLAEAMGRGGSASVIERQEKAGQQQLVNSDRLPSECRDRTALEALGFTFGEPDPDDPLFMPATLPAGWRREATDHDMWSHVVDQHGRQRVAVFYKAAFYDRRAFMRLETLENYVSSHVEYDGPLVITGEWATREAVAAEMEHLREYQVAEAAKWREMAAGRDNAARLLEYAAEHDAKAAKYVAALASVTA